VGWGGLASSNNSFILSVPCEDLPWVEVVEAAFVVFMVIHVGIGEV